jgi:hypothetical protein
VSGCGGAKRSAPPPPTLPRTLATALAAQSDAVGDALSAGDSCRALRLAQQLQRRTIAAINDGRVSGRLQEQLSGAVNELAARVTCVPQAAAPSGKNKHDHGKHNGHGKKHEEGD